MTERASPGPPPAVAVRALSHTFGRGDRAVHVLDRVDLDVAAGGFTSIVGPSGCGKSTVLRVLAGLLKPDAGEASVGGVSSLLNPGLVAYMPQKDLLLPWRRVIENATLGAEVAGVPRDEARAQAEALLPQFGLTGFGRTWPAQLSGGMRQRLALLRTFLTPSRVLLLDEPFGALDAITRREMHQWLQDVLRHEAARTVVFVTHDIEEALLLSDEVVVMSPRPGRIAATVAVPFVRPRSGALVVDPAFVSLKAALLGALEGR
ncbi:MAG: ABC transporter ATP-binding protein [Dehalococcoidia bacterium]